MKLSKLLLVMSVMLIGVYSLDAQRSPKSAEAMELRKSSYMDKLADELQLTDKQKAEIEKSNQKYIAERKSLVNDYQKVRDEHRAKMKVVAEKERAELDKILTAEQQAKLKALKEEKKAQRSKADHKYRKHQGVKQECIEEKKAE